MCAAKQWDIYSKYRHGRQIHRKYIKNLHIDRVRKKTVDKSKWFIGTDYNNSQNTEATKMFIDPWMDK